MTEQEQVRATQEATVRALSDDHLERELAFAETFGPDIHPNAQSWLDVLHAEKARRSQETS